MQLLQPTFPRPEPSNRFLAGHARLLMESFRNLTGRDLVDPGLDDAAAAQALWEAPFAVLSHDTAADPVFTYGNRTALALFELDWEQLSGMHSRLTAEAPDRAERARLLAAVAERGFVDDYAGVRISAGGRRFRIEGATVWTLNDALGKVRGQAAAIRRWERLTEGPSGPPV